MANRRACSCVCVCVCLTPTHPRTHRINKRLLSARFKEWARLSVKVHNVTLKDDDALTVGASVFMDLDDRTSVFREAGRAAHSAAMQAYWQSPAGQLRRAPGSDWRAGQSAARIAYYAGPQGQQRRADQSADLTAYYAGPQGQQRRADQSADMTAYYAGPQGQQRRADKSAAQSAYYAGPQGQQRRADQSAKGKQIGTQTDLAIIEDALNFILATGDVGVPELDDKRPSDIKDKVTVDDFREHIYSVFVDRKIAHVQPASTWKYHKNKLDADFSFSAKFDWKRSPALASDRERVLWLYVRFGCLRDGRMRAESSSDKKRQGQHGRAHSV
jgi:hypothetical protein